MFLDGKVVVVTGAGGGLGEGIARVCHWEGAAVVIGDIRGDAAASVATSLGDAALPVTCDVGAEDDRQHLVEAAVSEFGRIDGLVNNAGVNFVKPFMETTTEDWDRVIRVDLMAVFFLTQLVCQRMLAQALGGSVANISSVHSVAALPGAGPYDAAKSGVVGLTKSIAVELAAEDIRVNAISPGLLNTQIWQDLLAAAPEAEQVVDHWNSNIPIGRSIEPEEVGELAAFLLSDRSRSITGANMFVDGGMTSQLVSKEPYESESIDGS